VPVSFPRRKKLQGQLQIAQLGSVYTISSGIISNVRSGYSRYYSQYNKNALTSISKLHIDTFRRVCTNYMYKYKTLIRHVGLQYDAKNRRSLGNATLFSTASTAEPVAFKL
jgi:hypothetical protein